MIPAGSETQQKKLPVALSKREREVKREQREIDVFQSVIKYATGLSDVFIKLYSCPCLSKLSRCCWFVLLFARVFGAPGLHAQSALQQPDQRKYKLPKMCLSEKKGNAMGLISRCRQKKSGVLMRATDVSNQNLLQAANARARNRRARALLLRG